MNLLTLKEQDNILAFICFGVLVAIPFSTSFMQSMLQSRSNVIIQFMRLEICSRAKRKRGRREQETPCVVGRCPVHLRDCQRQQQQTLPTQSRKFVTGKLSPTIG